MPGFLWVVLGAMLTVTVMAISHERTYRRVRRAGDVRTVEKAADFKAWERQMRP